MITSRNQGQIFGAKPSMEEFERQLEADPATQAFGKLTALWAASVNTAKTFKRISGKVSFAPHRHHPAR